MYAANPSTETTNTMKNVSLCLVEDLAGFPPSNHFFHIAEHLIAAWVELNEQHIRPSSVRSVCYMRGPQARSSRLAASTQLNALSLPERSMGGLYASLLFPAAHISGLTCSHTANCSVSSSRAGHPTRGINKMYASFIGRFQTYSWMWGMQFAPLAEDLKRGGVNVLYIDRQGTTNRKLPVTMHQQIVALMREIGAQPPWGPTRMENLPVRKQAVLAARADVMIGGHGNGLTHQLAMRPGGFVCEIFHNFPYQFDYWTLAVAMQHQYILLWNGVVTSPVKMRLGQHHKDTRLGTALEFSSETLDDLRRWLSYATFMRGGSTPRPLMSREPVAEFDAGRGD